MYYRKSTQVPNKLFDIHLKTLSVKELKVLLIVVRQTMGWVDSNGNRKKRDWMSQRFFANKTGLSPKSVSQGIEMLVSKRLIVATSEDGRELRYPSDRKGQGKVFYGPSEHLITFLPKPYDKSTQDPSTKSNTTKLTYTKLRRQEARFAENSEANVKRLSEIIQKRMWE
jgi:hypothetical protein